MQHRLPSLFGTRTGLMTTVDYGYGSGHVRSWPSDTQVQTLSHLVYLLMSGHVVAGLDLFATLQANYDHTPVRLTYPFGVWLQLQAGASYAW